MKNYITKLMLGAALLTGTSGFIRAEINVDEFKADNQKYMNKQTEILNQIKDAQSQADNWQKKLDQSLENSRKPRTVPLPGGAGAMIMKNQQYLRQERDKAIKNLEGLKKDLQILENTRK
ncbi:MAG: hypothetical protein UU47_C0001G0100 [candidate division TM6 bacterium GW2011_GWE2_41_16]|nr:MAG: hypothetical protein UU47_C0001G0100 [candidate division TM6 bacterium GW2011_GWE2_41_16]